MSIKLEDAITIKLDGQVVYDKKLNCTPIGEDISDYPFVINCEKMNVEVVECNTALTIEKKMVVYK